MLFAQAVIGAVELGTARREVLAALAYHDVDGEIVRVVDHDVRFGVSTDEGDGDQWPAIRAKLLAAQILVIATPIWMGQPHVERLLHDTPYPAAWTGVLRSLETRYGMLCRW